MKSPIPFILDGMTAVARNRDISPRCAGSIMTHITELMRIVEQAANLEYPDCFYFNLRGIYTQQEGHPHVSVALIITLVQIATDAKRGGDTLVNPRELFSGYVGADGFICERESLRNATASIVASHILDSYFHPSTQ